MSEVSSLGERSGGIGTSQSVRKVVIPIAGLGTRFLPLSKSVAKELWPVVDLPVIQYIVEEVRLSGIREIIFVISLEKKPILDYFKESPKIEKILKERKKTQLLEELKKLSDISKQVTFSYVFQRRPLGDGHAVFQAAKQVGPEPCGLLFGDDIVDSATPCLAQLLKIFKTCQRPVVAIKRIAKEKSPSYGMVGVEKIANRLYKIKKIVEKPTMEATPSDLAIVGKYILTPEVFEYLARAKPGTSGEIVIAETFQEMINDGKVIYGYEFEGDWLECGNKLGWLKSNLCLSLKHPQYGPELKQYLREMKEI